MLLCPQNYWHIILPFVLLLRYLVWRMCNLQNFEVYYCLTVQSVLLGCNFSAAFPVFFPGIIFLKDSTGFNLLIEQHPFLLRCSSNYLYFPACSFSMERIYFFMYGIWNCFFYCCFLTMIFDWLYLLKFKFGYHAGTFFDDLASKLKNCQSSFKISFVAVWRLNKQLSRMDLYKHRCICVCVCIMAV